MKIIDSDVSLKPGARSVLKLAFLKLSLCLIIFWLNFAGMCLAPTVAEESTLISEGEVNQSPEMPKKEAGEPTPQLQPDVPKLDLPKLDVPREEPLPQKQLPVVPKRSQLKGSVQRNELLAPTNDQGGLTGKNTGRLDGSSRQGLLNGSAGKDMFRLKGNQIRGGLSRTREAGLGIIGLKFAVFFGRMPLIYQVFPDTPAEKAGLRPNDTIIAVDGIPTLGLSKNEVYSMIVGQPGTDVNISFRHKHEFQVRRMTRMDVNDIPDPKVRQDYLSM